MPETKSLTPEQEKLTKLLDDSKLPVQMKAEVWQNYFSSSGPDDFVKRMDSQKDLPVELKASLWNNKYKPADVPEARHKEHSPNSIGGGFGRRAEQTFKGLYDTVAKPPETQDEKALAASPLSAIAPVPAYRITKGLIDTEKEAGKQVKEQFGKHEYARSGVTALSMLDPFATGTVVDVNRLNDQERGREALGAGTFDVLTLLLGSRLGRAPKPEAKLAKLTYAAGGEREAIRSVMPDMEATAKRLGKPKTVGDLVNHVDESLRTLENEYNIALQPIRGNRIVPSQVAQKLLDRANRSNLRMTAEGRAERAALRKAALDFQRPWTMEQLDLERRSRFDARMAAKNDVKQMQATRSNVDTAINKIIEDELRDLVYSEMNRLNPWKDFGALKSRQSSLLDLKNKLGDQVKKLGDAQGVEEGRPFMARESVTAYVHPEKGNIGTRVHGLQKLLPGSGPEKSANRAVRQAHGPTTGATARRTAVLSLPVDALAAEARDRQKEDDKNKKKKTLTPLE